jgi:hypothetical protein
MQELELERYEPIRKGMCIHDLQTIAAFIDRT